MRLKNFMWLALLSCLWGPSFLFIKVAVTEIPPLTLVTGRVGVAAALLYLVLRAQGQRLPRFGRVWGHLAVMGLLNNAVPFLLISWGEQYVDSALAAILNGTMPLFTIILAHFFVADDRMTPAKLVGVLAGFGGLLLLIAPSLVEGVHATTWGLTAVAIASASYALSAVYARNHLRGASPIVPTAQLMLATLYLLPLALAVERPFNLPLPSWPALGSLLALAVLGTAMALVLYYHILNRTSPTFLSMVTYLLPVFGVILGVVVLDERLSWNAYAGCGLILFGVMVVNGVFRVLPWQRLARREFAGTSLDR